MVFFISFSLIFELYLFWWFECSSIVSFNAFNLGYGISFVALILEGKLWLPSQWQHHLWLLFWLRFMPSFISFYFSSSLLCQCSFSCPLKADWSCRFFDFLCCEISKTYFLFCGLTNFAVFWSRYLFRIDRLLWHSFPNFWIFKVGFSVQLKSVIFLWFGANSVCSALWLLRLVLRTHCWIKQLFSCMDFRLDSTVQKILGFYFVKFRWLFFKAIIHFLMNFSWVSPPASATTHWACRISTRDERNPLSSILIYIIQQIHL